MLEFFGQISAVQWFAIAALLLVVEVTTGTLYLLWVAAAAAVVGLLNWLGPDFAWEVDLALFAALSTLLLLFGHYVINPRINRTAADDLNEPANALIGRRARAVADFATGEGRVQLGDSQWRASTDDHILAGEELVVVGVEGSTLQVVVRED